MPRLSIWFIRTSLVYLMVGFTFGALMLINKGLAINPLLWRLLPAHVEILLVGWVVQLAMGVGFWILPRFQQGRGNTDAAWAAYFLLNAGIWLAAVASLGGPAWLPLAGRLLEAGATVAFAVNAWPRVKPAGA